MLKKRTLLCISCSICPTIYVNKHLSRLNYRRAPAKGSNPVVTRNRRIPFKNIWVIVRKQNLNQNFNLIVDATRPPAIPTNANLLAEIFHWKVRLKMTDKNDRTVFLNLFLHQIVKWSIYYLKRHDMVFHKIRSKHYY